MTKSERMADIKNRCDLAIAERNFTKPGTEDYKILSDIARSIREEYKALGKGSVNKIRNGFRLYNGHYHHVVLTDCEII